MTERPVDLSKFPSYGAARRSLFSARKFALMASVVAGLSAAVYGFSPQQGTMSNDQLALLGHLIGDGCVLPRHAVQYTTGDQPSALPAKASPESSCRVVKQCVVAPNELAPGKG